MTAVSGMPAADAINPFPGLRPFELEEDYLFFGRERQVDELMRKLRTTRFLSILGRSGSGKSSLVRSGLIPTLWGGGMTYAGSYWRVVIVRPGEDPIGNLAAALAARGALMDGHYDEELTRAFFETTLRASRLGLVECIEQARLPEGNNVLLVVDQFEEIFRYRRSRRIVGRDEAVAFVKLLLAMRESEMPCYVAITMRSDFIGDCMEFGKLPEVINEGIYLVPRMSRDDLKAAITGPVGVGGATITPRLVSRLLNDAGDDPDQLPLLQHALMRTWSRWLDDHEAGEGLDLRQYEAVGTLHDALSRHAEEAFSELNERQQTIAEKLFKALTDTGSEARGVRRPAAVGEICAVADASVDDVIAIVETFRMPGRSFLMPPADVPLTETSVVDISHESLMRIWNRLSEWADEEARAGQLYLSVARAAQRHEEGVAALWRDPELQLALTWRANESPTEEWARRYDPSFARAMAFLDASRDERDRDLRERDERRRRELRAARRLVAVLATASILTFGLGAYAFVQKGRAEKETVRAEDARGHAVAAQRAAEYQKERAEQQRGRAESEQRRAVSEQQRAEAERVRAAERSEFAETQRRIAEEERTKAETNEREARAQKAAAEVAQQAAVSEKRAADSERQKAVTSETETRRLSRLDAARALALTIPQQKEQVQRETSALLALEAWRLNRDNRGNLQDPEIFTALRSALERLRPLPVLRGEQAVRALAVSPDGKAAFSGGEDGSVVRVDLSGGKPAEVGRLGAAIRSIAATGDRLAAGSSGGEIRVWDPRNPAAPPRVLGDGKSAVSALALAPGAPLLAAGRIDGSLTIFDLDRGAAAQLPAGGGQRITAVAFSPDRKVLAAGAGKSGALLWNLDAPQAAPRAACAGLDVRSIAFRPDGKGIACGGARGQIVQDDLGAAASVTLTAHRSAVNALSFDRRGGMLASASSDGTVRLWESGKSDAQPIVLPGHDSWVWGVSFSPNGEHLISAGEDRTVRIWPAKAEVAADELCRAVAQSSKKQLSKDEWSKYMPADLAQERSPCAPR
jgi:WD40 repeat protein/energy-coupling factor transporter ATP-binding protein EcfA2